MGYELAFEARHIGTNGDHVDDVDHLATGASLVVYYTVDNVGDEAVPARYDFLSITDNGLQVEYEDYAERDGFELAADQAFDVPMALSPGVHWVFVTVDWRGNAPKLAARVVIVAGDEVERARYLEQLSGSHHVS
jgi:hypothetical protein